MVATLRSDHTHVLLLRGINVGGRAMVSMADLRSVAESAGAKAVSTHLNSGNVLFRVDPPAGAAADAEARRVAGGVASALAEGHELAEGHKMAEEHGLALGRRQAEDRGLEITVIVVDRADLETALALHGQLAFAGGEDKLTHLVVLAEPAGPEQADDLEALDAGPDRCAVTGRLVWIRYADASHSSKLSLDRIEKILRTRGTARNLLTVPRLAAVA